MAKTKTRVLRLNFQHREHGTSQLVYSSNRLYITRCHRSELEDPQGLKPIGERTIHFRFVGHITWNHLAFTLDRSLHGTQQKDRPLDFVS